MTDHPTPPQTIGQLMTQALAMEREAVARYTELAEMMETHNNVEVAALFRKMALVEGHHVEQIRAGLRGNADEATLPSLVWPGTEGPESVPLDAMHYLMHPWHALHLALAAEERAAAFYGALADSAPTEAVRSAAAEMRDEEVEHVALVQAWLERVPRPADDWAEDPDPPRHVD